MSTPFSSFIHKDHKTIYTLYDKYFHPSSKIHPRLIRKTTIRTPALREIFRHIKTFAHHRITPIKHGQEPRQREQLIQTPL
ncbi:hypothetical protein P691DRAFT_810162 [Macrolepiota fuliginosa MF-IS2]|uniref:Uncharacterized protein n=1 Tax=Macrolepiota fuliginosa MF-IS2 TaxID=1400762 RepID=A0A9P5X4K3_9AGAR|nr:hypothetical protein P691DRAFT_810162 [Macrolepiota fuliginosa MF-IS2]